ncbi:hypothetical protein CSQ96_16180 [Janthinobacterium sp. BJB412]|nr:hypothetical protein CSQ96_16180 [Janthinobacterium sp. BJB412]
MPPCPQRWRPNTVGATAITASRCCCCAARSRCSRIARSRASAGPRSSFNPSFDRNAMRGLSHYILLSALAGAPALALAFGADGHQQVGAIADALLKNSRAEQEVKRLLGELDLRTVAVWADCARAVGTSDDKNFIYTVATSRDPARQGEPAFPECTVFESDAGKERLRNFVAHNWRQCGKAHGGQFCHSQYHYTDVASVHSSYAEGYVGTSEFDVVHAIRAATAYLRGQPAPAPFVFADQQEALMLLAHYVGDIHQPLHAVQLYLDADGRALDPDAKGNKPGYDTAGGNLLLSGKERLHGKWDAVPAALKPGGAQAAALLQQARCVAPTAGDEANWSTRWAGESVAAAPRLFAGLRFTLAAGSSGGDDAARNWDYVVVDPGYEARADAIKAEQLAKAGARLAWLLQAIWPDQPAVAGAAGGADQGGGAMAAAAAPSGRPPAPYGAVPAAAVARQMAGCAAGYLPAAPALHIERWLPAPPKAGGAAEAADIAAFKHSRATLRTARGRQAAEDDVFVPAEVLPRFGEALGVELNGANAPLLAVLLKRLQADAARLVGPLKRTVAEGGRRRPFVAFPAYKSCLYPVDMAGHRRVDMVDFSLDKTGSYPSTHAWLGLTVAMLLAEAAPERADALLARGMAFGDSRVVCGFHYPSDVAAGRSAAAALYARLRGDAAFANDVELVRREVAAARAR